MQYIHIIIFLLTHNLTELKEFWRVEFVGKEKSFKLRRLIRALRRESNKFLFWFRLVDVMYKTGSNKQKQIARIINAKISIKYNTFIELGAQIGTGLTISHPHSIIINKNVVIGKNFRCLQNVTIGQSKKEITIKIGNNVTVGANSVIIGGMVIIGDNVEIGAMSFINKDVHNNCIVYTEKNNILKIRKQKV